ncbi:MAG: formate acetyltransferase, partial [Treponemataceae bacterium]|nr:formate acetyltransferase [Treponemataceae bacterium]
MALREEWAGFKAGRLWQDEINVREFIQMNYTPYDGDASFLAGPTGATQKLFDELQKLQKAEHNKVVEVTETKKNKKTGEVTTVTVKRSGVLDLDTDVVTGLTSHPAGYICPEGKDLEKVVGLQTDKPLKRAFMPFGGIKMAEQSCAMYGYKPNEELHKIFTEYHKTHNDAVFDVYTPEIRKARSAHILTGLPDTYGRGRIVGDYRRVALYGIDFIMESKQKDLANCGNGTMSEEVIRQREEIAEQIKALKGIKAMAAIYGYDISKPARNAREAFQWLYFGYLAAIKTQNGAAMSVGRISTFLDIYIERDIKNGTLTEEAAQELVD